MGLPAVIGAGVWGWRLYSGYRAVRAAQMAAQAAQAAMTADRIRKAAQLAKAAEQAAALAQAKERDEPCTDCDEDPCEHLRRGTGNGDYRGGAHSGTKKPTGDGLDSHHIPAKDAYDLPHDDMPAIQMKPEDHRATMSNGNKGAAGARWRQKQADLIKAGKMDEAVKMDIDDLRRIAREAGDPDRYEEAIKEMEAYRKCRAENGLDGNGGSDK